MQDSRRKSRYLARIRHSRSRNKILSGVEGGAVNQGITFEKNSAPGFFAFCGLGASPDSIGMVFDVSDNEKNLIYQSTPAEFNRSYKFQLNYDPKTMQFSCFASGKLIGVIKISDAAEMKISSFERQISGWRDSSTTATAVIDNIRIGMP